MRQRLTRLVLYPTLLAAGVAVDAELPLGESRVGLRVEDGFGGVDSDDLLVRVVDRTPPSVSATLAPVRGGRGLFEVAFACRDRCDPSPALGASFAGRAVANGELVRAGGGRPQLRVRCEDASGNAALRATGPGVRVRGGPPLSRPQRWPGRGP